MGVGSKCASEVLVTIAMLMGGWIVSLKDGTCDFPKQYEKSLAWGQLEKQGSRDAKLLSIRSKSRVARGQVSFPRLRFEQINKGYCLPHSQRSMQ